MYMLDISNKLSAMKYSVMYSDSGVIGGANSVPLQLYVYTLKLQSIASFENRNVNMVKNEMLE